MSLKLRVELTRLKRKFSRVFLLDDSQGPPSNVCRLKQVLKKTIKQLEYINVYYINPSPHQTDDQKGNGSGNSSFRFVLMTKKAEEKERNHFK